MANERDRDELDDTPESDETARGLGDEFEDEGEDEDLEDEDDEVVEDERATGEVGSEGGSPGDQVTKRRPDEPLQGSEATETARKPR